MAVVIVVAALVVLALVTQIGVFFSERAHPAQGRMVEVAGGALHILDIGPRDAAGPPIVMLAPVAYPWPGGVGRYNKIIATPVIGPLLAYTITLPLGHLLAERGARVVFLPQTMPDDFVRDTATPLLLRPREFIANARDFVTLKAAVAEQAPRYAEITAPITIITGDESDKTVSTRIHSRPLAAAAPNAKLIVLPGVGHMIQQAAPDLAIAEVEAMIGAMTPRPAAAPAAAAD